MEEGGDVAHDVWDDVWFHIVNLLWVAAKDVLENMSNEILVNIGRGILVVGGVDLFCCRFVVVFGSRH